MPTVLNKPQKALVAKYWTAAILADFGYKLEFSAKSNHIYAARAGGRVLVRCKACYSEDGVPFNGFDTRDSDLVVFVDLRHGARKAEAWIVPTRVVVDGLEREYGQMTEEDGRAGSQVPNRTLYWPEGPGRHYGYERKFAKYRNAWTVLHQAIAAKSDEVGHCHRCDAADPGEVAQAQVEGTRQSPR